VLLITGYSTKILNFYWHLVIALTGCRMPLSCCMISITVIVGEVANFVAYAFAPAVLVTPLGALSIIVR
jgi:hypothetical protein